MLINKNRKSQGRITQPKCFTKSLFVAPSGKDRGSLAHRDAEARSRPRTSAESLTRPPSTKAKLNYPRPMRTGARQMKLSLKLQTQPKHVISACLGIVKIKGVESAINIAVGVSIGLVLHIKQVVDAENEIQLLENL